MNKVSQTIKTILLVLISILTVVVLYSMIFRVDFFNTGINYYMEFDQIGTIVTGSPVRKAGVKVGSVIEVNINPETQRTVLLLVRLFPGNIIRKSDQISILTGGLLGDQFIDILPGDPSAEAYAPFSLIKGRPSFDLASIAATGEDVLKEVTRVSALIGNLIDRNSESISNSLSNIEKLSKDLQVLGRTVNTLDTEVTRISNMLGPTLESIQKTAVQIESLAKTLNSSESIFGYVNRPSTRNKIDSILTELQEVTQNLNSITKEIQSALKP